MKSVENDCKHFLRAILSIYDLTVCLFGLCFGLLGEGVGEFKGGVSLLHHYLCS